MYPLPLPVLGLKTHASSPAGVRCPRALGDYAVLSCLATLLTVQGREGGLEVFYKMLEQVPRGGPGLLPLRAILLSAVRSWRIQIEAS